MTAITARNNDKNIKVCLLGPSFGTGNLGVDALVEASIKVIVNRWPDAQITLLGSGLVDREHELTLFGREVRVKSMPIRFCFNIFKSHHFIGLCLYALLLKIFPGGRMREALAKRNPLVQAIVHADMVADITGGDSFSDIYGMRRFVIGFLRKWISRAFGKKLVLLPQTYGPFDKRLTRILARYIVKNAQLVYSRDRNGVEVAKALLAGRDGHDKIKFVPDVALLLDPRRPDSEEIESLEKIKDSCGTLVGLNISGLLCCSSEPGGNLFHLKVNYPALIDSIVEFLMKQEDVSILLVPHVVGTRSTRRRKVASKGYREQSDSIACERLFERMGDRYPGRIFAVREHYSHNETKYIIGLCDFFIGSRMHSCIAALSQSIPALGLAYSDKFAGVFDSLGVGDLVIDLRKTTEGEVLSRAAAALGDRSRLVEELGLRVAEAQKKVLCLFQNGGECSGERGNNVTPQENVGADNE